MTTKEKVKRALRDYSDAEVREIVGNLFFLDEEDVSHIFMALESAVEMKELEDFKRSDQQYTDQIKELECALVKIQLNQNKLRQEALNISDLITPKE